MKQFNNITIGNLIIFGSGETLSTGKRIQRRFFRTLSNRQNIVVLETPAGFQPNSEFVAREIADVFRKSLFEFVDRIEIVPARKKGTFYSPDNPEILAPLTKANYIFLGPGSPTYALSQLRNSKALELIKKQWKNGATICLSSAAALAFGTYTLPVYEIYKVGSDLYWEKGLDVLKDVGLDLTVVTHWNNKEGGEHLDTSCCFVGQDRFSKLREFLPVDHPLLCIDEHTAIIFDFKSNSFSINGKGTARFLKGGKEIVFQKNKFYSIESLHKFSVIEKGNSPTISIRSKKEKKIAVDPNNLPADLYKLFLQREKARKKGDFVKADRFRNTLKKKGYIVEDTEAGQEVFTV